MILCEIAFRKNLTLASGLPVCPYTLYLYYIMLFHVMLCFIRIPSYEPCGAIDKMKSAFFSAVSYLVENT